MYFKQFYGMYTDEWCSFCGKDQSIPAWKTSTCPTCGERIVPCSMCDNDNIDCNKCPLIKNDF